MDGQIKCSIWFYSINFNLFFDIDVARKFFSCVFVDDWSINRRTLSEIKRKKNRFLVFSIFDDENSIFSYLVAGSIWSFTLWTLGDDTFLGIEFQIFMIAVPANISCAYSVHFRPFYVFLLFDFVNFDGITNYNNVIFLVSTEKKSQYGWSINWNVSVTAQSKSWIWNEYELSTCLVIFYRSCKMQNDMQKLH